MTCYFPRQTLTMMEPGILYLRSETHQKRLWRSSGFPGSLRIAITFLSTLLPGTLNADDPTLTSSLLNQGVQPVFEQYSQGELPQPQFHGLVTDFSDYKMWLQQEFDEKRIPGIAMAIVSSSAILDVQTWGVRSVGQETEVDADTVFPDCVSFQDFCRHGCNAACSP